MGFDTAIPKDRKKYRGASGPQSFSNCGSRFFAVPWSYYVTSNTNNCKCGYCWGSQIQTSRMPNTANIGGMFLSLLNIKP